MIARGCPPGANCRRPGFWRRLLRRLGARLVKSARHGAFDLLEGTVDVTSHITCPVWSFSRLALQDLIGEPAPRLCCELAIALECHRPWRQDRPGATAFVVPLIVALPRRVCATKAASGPLVGSAKSKIRRRHDLLGRGRNNRNLAKSHFHPRAIRSSAHSE